MTAPILTYNCENCLIVYLIKRSSCNKFPETSRWSQFADVKIRENNRAQINICKMTNKIELQKKRDHMSQMREFT